MDAVRHCDVCRFTGETAHAYSVHMKGMPHLRAVEKAEERRALVAEETNKDEARERFARQWQQTMQPLCESYIEAVQLTVGGIHERPRMPACNTLSESIAAVYELSRPRAHVVARRKALYKFVFRVCKALWPDAKLDVYGSIPHKLDSEGSDIDMSVSPVDGLDDAAVLSRVARAIECCQSPYLAVTRVLHARIPVISIADTLADGLRLDLSIWNVDKLHISTIFARYMDLDARVRPLIFAVRQWSKARAINDAFQGYVNSFAWTVAVVCYLMERKLVPVVDVDSDCTVAWAPPDGGATPLGELLLGFLCWFRDWDYKSTRLSMRHGGVVPKEAERFEDYTYVCIERPRTPWQNVTRQVEPHTWKLIRQELSHAIAALKGGAMLDAILK